MTQQFDLRQLETPFVEEDLEWRLAQSGMRNNKPWAKCLVYINARAVMDRLDEVVGPENWKDRYWKEGDAIMCGLSIKINGEWIEKIDGSEASDIEAVKGGLSGALKRAAVKWMIGRYLYKLTEGWVEEFSDKGGDDWHYAKTKEGATFYWKPPHMPKWALPEGYKPRSRASVIAQEKTEQATDDLRNAIAPKLAVAPPLPENKPQLVSSGPSTNPEATPQAPMPGAVFTFLEETKESVMQASTMMALQAAVNLYNAKVKLGQENKPGGVAIPETFRVQVKNDMTAFFAKRKSELSTSA